MHILYSSDFHVKVVHVASAMHVCVGQATAAHKNQEDQLVQLFISAACVEECKISANENIY